MNKTGIFIIKEAGVNYCVRNEKNRAYHVTALITARQHINMVHRTHYPLTGLLMTIFLPPKRLHKAHTNVKTCYFEIRLSDAPFEVVDCRRQECTFTCELNYISQFLFAQR